MSVGITMYRTTNQPYPDHVSFATGKIGGEEGKRMEVPHEFYTMSLARWKYMGAPDKITVAVGVVDG